MTSCESTRTSSLDQAPNPKESAMAWKDGFVIEYTSSQNPLPPDGRLTCRKCSHFSGKGECDMTKESPRELGCNSWRLCKHFKLPRKFDNEENRAALSRWKDRSAKEFQITTPSSNDLLRHRIYICCYDKAYRVLSVSSTVLHLRHPKKKKPIAQAWKKPRKGGAY